MKPNEGRSRVVIEQIEPSVDMGRYPAKRVLGDSVEVTAAIFADGHDHIAAQLLYRHSSQKRWQTAKFTALTNDLWSATFPVDKLGEWAFTVEAWIDHFDTWVADLAKRLAAQQDGTQDIPLALRIGANHVEATGARAKGADAKRLKQFAADLVALADQKLDDYDSPLADELVSLMEKYPDRSFATRYAAELPLWVDRERARFSSWYELFPRSASDTPGQHGTLRDVTARVPEIAAMGFDVLYMPPIHPIGVAYRKGKNNSVTAAARGPSARQRADTQRSCRSWAALPTSTRSSPLHRRTISTSRWTLPSSARLTILGSRSIPSGSTIARTAQSSTQRTRRRNIRTSTRSTLNPQTGAASGTLCTASSSSGATAAYASSASTTRTLRRCRSGSGASPRC